jgi:hypothetical protein
MIPDSLLPIANHLWQSTVFAGIAGVLTLLLRKNRAHARYCLWLAASAKFLVPFSLLMLVGGLVGRHSMVLPAPTRVPVLVEQVNEPFVARVPSGAVAMPHASKSALVPTVGDWLRRFGVLVVDAMAPNAGSPPGGVAGAFWDRNSCPVFGIDP